MESISLGFQLECAPEAVRLAAARSVRLVLGIVDLHDEMIDRLFVILGAGASFDCVSEEASVPLDPDYWPPLTPDLFTTKRRGYAEILAKYPLIKAASAELSTIDSAVGLEAELRERYRDSEHEHDRQIFRGVLPYLQELLHTVSDRFTEFPQNYEVLATKLLRLKELMFISLNYDVLLDNALLTFDSAKTGLDWYVRQARNWSLIKLHGSVDWGVLIPGTEGIQTFTAPRADLSPASGIMLRPGQLFEKRGFISEKGAHGTELFFPALSAPVGEADELVCPPDHVDLLRARLTETQPMHVLVIGYSGIDKEIVSLIRESGRGIKTLTIVDRGEDAALAVAQRMAQEGVGSEDTKPSPDSFDTWVRGGGLTAFVNEMTGQPF
jgi:hypothetical protein